METEEDKKIAKLLKKMRAKPQFGLGQVPQYGKARSGREYGGFIKESVYCLLYTSPSPRDGLLSRMPSSA